MDFFNKMKAKASVEFFSEKKPELDKIRFVLKAGHSAPTTGDQRPQRILVIDRERSFKYLNTCMDCSVSAPLAMVLCYDREVSWKRPDGKDFGILDVYSVAAHMMNTIHNLGLAAKIVKKFNHFKLKDIFDIPEQTFPVLVMYIGYPAMAVDILLNASLCDHGYWS